MTGQVNPRTFIEQLCKKNGVNDHMAKKVANGLEAHISTSFGLGSFIREFLQNARDQATTKDVKISFTLIKGELIVAHNGKPFSQEDVQGICDYANAADNQKSQDKEKAGHKDLGFKSIFKVADRVDICSREWFFHFDEKNERWKRKLGENPYPWQIAPIWTEDAELKDKGVDKALTTFICRLRDPGAVALELKEFAQNPEEILFLQKIHNVAFTIDGKKFDIVHANSTLTVNGEPKSRWKCLESEVSITPEVKAFLKTLNPAQCPSWLQKDDTRSVKLSFNYQMDGDLLISHSPSRLFCTLSTGVTTHLPFLVNAPFLLNPSREALQETNKKGDWNLFLITEIAREHFRHIQEFFKEKNKNVLKVLAPAKLLGLTASLTEAFTTTLDENLEKVAFIPPQTGKKLLKLRQCAIDCTGFYRMIQEANLSLQATDTLVHPAIDPKEMKLRFPKIKALTHEDVIRTLPELMKRHSEPETCAHVLTFFSKIFISGKKYDPAHLDLLKEQPVMTSDRQLVPLQEVVLPFKDGIPLPACLPLHIIHPGVLNPEIISWLEKIGIKRLTAEGIVNEYAERLKDESLKTKSNNLTVMRLLFYFYKERLIKDQHLRKLNGILIFSEAGTPQPSHQLYLPSTYEPKFPLQNHLADHPEIFVSDEYRRAGEEIPLWKSFFLQLGVSEQCAWIFSQKVKVKEARKIPGSFILNYLKHIFRDDNPDRPAKTDKRNYESSDELYPCAYFPFLKWIKESSSFRAYFWTQLIENQSKILSSYATTTYHAFKVPNGVKKQDCTYLEYVFRNHALILNTKGKPYTAAQLYAPSMERLLGPRFPTASLPVSLSTEMESFLGFKRIIDVDDCHQILEELAEDYQHDLYITVMRHLLMNIQETDRGDEILQKKWKFQSTNNEWIPSSKLKWWTSHSYPPADSQWMKPVFQTETEMEEFCAFFKMECVAEVLDRSLFSTAKESVDLKEFLWKKIPLIACKWATHCNFEKESAYYIHFLLTEFGKLKFLSVPDEEDDESTTTSQVSIVLLGNELIYFSDWQEHKSVLSENLAQFLKFGEAESLMLKQTLCFQRLIKGGGIERLSEFQEVFEELTKSPKAPPPPSPASPPAPHQSIEESIQEDGENDSESDQVSPREPVTPPSKKGTKKEKKPEEPWTPSTPASDTTESPIQDEPAPKTGWQPKVNPRGFVPKSGTGSKKGRGLHHDDSQDRDNKLVGLWAEEHVLYKRIEKYQNKYEDESPVLEDLQNGTRRLSWKTHQVVIELIWNNDPQARPEEFKDEETWDSGKPFDIEVIRKDKGEVVKQKKLEVKGTTGKQIHFYLQAREWRTLLTNPAYYRIYVVTEAGEQAATITRYKDLLSALRDQKIFPISKTEFSY